jgi:predicted  nucleic acid-binding Zn-ribbon protein
MERTSILYTAVIMAGIGAICVRRIDDRIERLEQAPRVTPKEVRIVSSELDRLSLRVEATLQVLDELSLASVRHEGLEPRLQEIEDELRSAALSLGEQRSRLVGFEHEQRAAPERVALLVGSQLDCRVEELRAEIDERYLHIRDIAQTTRAQVQEVAHEVEQTLVRDEDRMWRELVGPVVQLNGTETVGSGVLLESRPIDEQRWRTCILTAWHVVRDIVQEGDPRTTPIPVTIYRPERETRFESAFILAHEPSIDAALLVLDTDQRVDCGAKLASTENIARRRIFDQIYAVGCPLGNDPIPTFGEIADTHHRVDDLRYWMISAPTYIGNSGGGIFDAESHELLGIFSKIYTHGSLRPTVVPHMGLVVPLIEIYEWLERTEQLSLLEPAPAAQARTASSAR